MYALIDCNSFFCSVEKVFHPGLEGKPVCVLSNNDGCIVALTPEAKRIGLHRGDPMFKIRDMVQRNHVTVFSSNMALYAAMSQRITDILRKSVSHVEKYSIDESFCRLDEYENSRDSELLMRNIADRIRLWTDIPVSIGIAASKTLAKVGSKFAKTHSGYKGVCMIENDEKRRKALFLSELNEIWGIGRNTLLRLQHYGVKTPLEFADKPEDWVRSRFALPTVSIWKELNGIPCIDTSEIIRKQSICTSRSFGNMITDIESIKESVAYFASECARKLRRQQSVAGTVRVYLYSSRFLKNLPQYDNAGSHTFDIKTSDTIEICSSAVKLAEMLYRPGVMYKKSAVVLEDISDNKILRPTLFDGIQGRENRDDLMASIDRINRKYGSGALHIAAEGGEKKGWKPRCEYKSRNYLTNIDELLTIEI